MINDIKNKYETYTISQNIVNRVISTIRHKYSNLTKNEIDNLVEEACNAYNEFVEENNNLKIIIPKFLIFYISKKIDYNFSKEDILIFFL